jgi:hypothetical protein
MPKSYAITYQKELVAQWQQSDQTKTAFARSQGIVPNTFWKWARKYSEPAIAVVSAKAMAEVAVSVGPSFLDVTPVPKAIPITVRVGLPGQRLCELAFDAPPPPTWFAAVLREVAAC